VVVKTRDGEVMVKELKRRTARALELASLNPVQNSAHDQRKLAASDIEWIARIVWARQ
jgi:phage repressor protein C with HTH and peptisase S24 domain